MYKIHKSEISKSLFLSMSLRGGMRLNGQTKWEDPPSMQTVPSNQLGTWKEGKNKKRDESVFLSLELSCCPPLEYQNSQFSSLCDPRLTFEAPQFIGFGCRSSYTIQLPRSEVFGYRPRAMLLVPRVSSLQTAEALNL